MLEVLRCCFLTMLFKQCPIIFAHILTRRQSLADCVCASFSFRRCETWEERWGEGPALSCCHLGNCCSSNPHHGLVRKGRALETVRSGFPSAYEAVWKCLLEIKGKQPWANKWLEFPSSLLITHLLPVSTTSFGEPSGNFTSPVSVAASLPANKNRRI